MDNWYNPTYNAFSAVSVQVTWSDLELITFTFHLDKPVYEP